MAHLPAPPPPRLLDRVRAALRTRHCSLRTEKAYVGWIRRYIVFHGKRHPTEMGAAEITRFLSDLAIQRNVAASTQNQALSALLFLYREVLEQELPWLDDIERARNSERIPVVLTREEVQAVIDALDGPTRLPALLLYGAGLRLLEALRLRVKDVDFGRNQITVRSGKGGKDRVTMLPAAASRDLAKHLETIRDQHDGDLRAGAGWVELPWALARKYPAPAASGSGSGSFRPPAPTCTARPTSAAAITCTNPCCSARSRRRYAVRASPSAPPATPSATPLPPTS
jgi:integron integrase